jgi:hypothetical protein
MLLCVKECERMCGVVSAENKGWGVLAVTRKSVARADEVG